MINSLIASMRQAAYQDRTPVRWVLGRIFARQLCAEYGLPVEAIQMVLGLPVEVDDTAPLGWVLIAR